MNVHIAGIDQKGVDFSRCESLVKFIGYLTDVLNGVEPEPYVLNLQFNLECKVQK